MPAITEDQVKAVWRNADCVCFDVDSTVCSDEGVDELASFLNVGDEVAELTNQAMGGGMSFKESFRKRLNVMRPSQEDITHFLAENSPKLTAGVKDLIGLLQERNVAVYLISGGMVSIIEKVAEEINVPKTNIFANKLTFYYNGEYAGFDEEQLTCATGGKPKVIELLKSKHGYQQVVHIGDGLTDMEASPPAEAFIGFGGNVIRTKVENGSSWFVKTFQELIDELDVKRKRTDES